MKKRIGILNVVLFDFDFSKWLFLSHSDLLGFGHLEQLIETGGNLLSVFQLK